MEWKRQKQEKDHVAGLLGCEKHRRSQFSRWGTFASIEERAGPQKQGYCQEAILQFSLVQRELKKENVMKTTHINGETAPWSDSG